MDESKKMLISGCCKHQFTAAMVLYKRLAQDLAVKIPKWMREGPQSCTNPRRCVES